MGTAELVLYDYEDYDSAEDEYYYGHRIVEEYDENGNCRIRYLPLTPEDFLDPEEGDRFMQGELHIDDVIKLRSIFRHHLRKQENIKVYCDVKIVWGIEGLKNPAPDICIVRDVRNPEEFRTSFHVPEEGTKPFFVMEVVSPRYRDGDINEKPDIYRKAGVSEYIIADPGFKRGKISYTISGYRLIDTRYVKIEPDSRGRIRSLTTGILVGTAESDTRLVVYDAVTGKEILPDEERAEQEKARAKQAKNIAKQEKARAKQAENMAEQEKAKAKQEKAKAKQAENMAEQEKAKAKQAENMAEQEKARADSTEEELMRLKAKMKALGISED